MGYTCGREDGSLGWHVHYALYWYNEKKIQKLVSDITHWLWLLWGNENWQPEFVKLKAKADEGWIVYCHGLTKDAKDFMLPVALAHTPVTSSVVQLKK